MSAVDPHAATGWNGDERRRLPPDDCEAGTRALHLLCGDPNNPEAASVFAQLVSLRRQISWVGFLVCAPLWVLAGIAIAGKLGQ